MTGTWGGTFAQTWSSALGPGEETCEETWTVTGQTAGSFTGTYQAVPGTDDGCRSTGTITGTVLPDGAVEVRRDSASPDSSGCVLTAGDGRYRGSVSQNSALTAQASLTLRCPYGDGTLDNVVIATVSMIRQ